MEPYVNIEQAVDLLNEGQVVAVPTETVYGLAADATNDSAITLIYKTKNRPAFNPLIIHVITLEQAKSLVRLNDRAIKLADTFWPGPLTMVLPLADHSPVSKLACAGLDTLAIRIPGHTIMQTLISALQKPIAAPSANPSLFMSPTTAEHVIESFHGAVPVIDGGPCARGIESTIIDLSVNVPVILRPGPITADQIEKIIGHVETLPQQHIKAPGQLQRHYAPSKPMRLNVTTVEPDEGLIAFGHDIPEGAMITMSLSLAGDLNEAAANLFRVLHEMDRKPVKRIAVMPIPDEELGIAINDRLRRAAAQK